MSTTDEASSLRAVAFVDVHACGVKIELFPSLPEEERKGLLSFPQALGSTNLSESSSSVRSSVFLTGEEGASLRAVAFVGVHACGVKTELFPSLPEERKKGKDFSLFPRRWVQRTSQSRLRPCVALCS